MNEVTGFVFQTAQTGPRVEMDAEGAWYCDDDPEVRIPYAAYLAVKATLLPLVLR